MRKDYIAQWGIVEKRVKMNFVDFLILKYQEGLSAQEIADEMKKKDGISLTARSIQRQLWRHGCPLRHRADSFRNAVKRGRVTWHWKKVQIATKKRNLTQLSPKTRFLVLERDGRKCKVCGSTELLEVDHIEARILGGSNDLSNLQTLCHECNIGKRAALRERLTHHVMQSGGTLPL